jgi:hypothetical protein
MDICKVAAVAQSGYYAGIFLVLRKVTKNFVQDSRCFKQNLKRAPPKYKF